MRVLFVSANPGSTEKLDLADELRNFQQSLKGHNVNLTLLPAAQLDDLELAIESNDYQVIHFSGHAKDEGILMRNSVGNEELVDSDKLRDLFEKSKDTIRLVFLNACDTKEVAEKLQTTTVGMVIGTKTKLDDDVAKAMTDIFYSKLGNGQSLAKAFADATSEIKEYFPEELYVYKDYGEEKDKDEVLLKDKKSDQSSVRIEGLPTWDKHFQVAHLDRQISSAKEQILLNQKLLRFFLLAGVVLAVVILIIFPVDLATLNPFTDKAKLALVGKKPLLEWLAAVGAGIPVAIAAFKKHFLISGNNELILLRQLRSMVRSSDDLSPPLQKRLHIIMEQSVLGTNST